MDAEKKIVAPATKGEASAPDYEALYKDLVVRYGKLSQLFNIVIELYLNDNQKR